MLSDAIRRIAEGECVVDPTIVSGLMKRARDDRAFAPLSARERSILALMAAGHRWTDNSVELVPVHSPVTLPA